MKERKWEQDNAVGVRCENKKLQFVEKDRVNKKTNSKRKEATVCGMQEFFFVRMEGCHL